MTQHPFTSVDENDAVRIATEVWGYFGVSAERLDSEMDDSFLIRGSDGGRVLKVTAPQADERQLSFLGDLADWLHDTGAPTPTQQALRTRDGVAMVTFAHQGSHRSARLLTYLPGSLLSECSPSGPQWRAIGSALGDFDAHLASFDHADSPTTTQWDLRHLGDHDTGAIGDATVRSMVEQVIDDFSARVLPRLPELPQQFIHNDFNRGNLLVDHEGDRALAGVIDFGDAMVGPRVFDAAIAAAYAITGDSDPWSDAALLLHGYLAALPLTSAEQDIIPDLVIARQAQRLLLNAAIVRSLPQSEKNTQRYRDETAAQLRALLTAERPDLT